MSDPDHNPELPAASALALAIVACMAHAFARFLGALLNPGPPPEAEGFIRYRRRR